MSDQIISDEYVKLLTELHEHFVVHGNVTLPVQLLKLAEEVGEVAESYIGATGANPRKGTTHTMAQVALELADVALVAMLAIQFMAFDVNAVLQQQARKTRMRLDEFAFTAVSTISNRTNSSMLEKLPKELAIETRIAKIKSTMLGFEGHGIFTGILNLDYGNSGQSAGGYDLRISSAAAAFVQGVLRATGVDQWEKVAGRTVLALCEDGYHGRVIGIKPLPTELGTEFLFESINEA